MRQMLRVVWVLLLSAAVYYAPAQSLGSTRSEVERQHNLRICLSGTLSSLCDHSLLRSEEVARVREAERQHNLRICLSGTLSSLCDHSLLRSEEVARVREAERQHNLRICLSGTLSSLCDHSLLRSEEVARVREAETEYTSRSSRVEASPEYPLGYSLAGQSGSDRVSSELPIGARVPGTGTSISLPKIAKPRCAENGSCYGDISPVTLRPKTVHVRGYYRKDGTYVRGHYRSRQRR